MSESKIGLYDGENNPMFGVHLKHTDEWKKWASERFSGEGNPMYGVHLTMSDERKKQLSEIYKGQNNPFYGKKHDEETRKRMSEKKKKSPVLCVETNTSYESINEAKKSTLVHSGSISRACKTGGIAGGFHWKYIA